MTSSTAVSPMQYVHEILAAEYGRMAAALEDDGRVQPVYLPGGEYALLVAQTSDTTITFRKAVGAPDFERPGLADFLLTTHSRWLFGRFERNEDMLVVEHTVTIDSLTPATVARLARTVHDEAVNAEHTLQAIGALGVDD